LNLVFFLKKKIEKKNTDITLGKESLILRRIFFDLSVLKVDYVQEVVNAII